MIKFPYEGITLNDKDIKQLKTAGFNGTIHDGKDYYEAKVLFDLSDVVAFEQTWFNKIEPPEEAIFILFPFEHSITIKDTYENFKNEMIKAGLLK